MSGPGPGSDPAGGPARAPFAMATGRPRPIGSRRELAGWYLMRLSGLGLFVLALSHFLITHVVYDPAEQTAAWIIDERWGDALWRVTDASMLVLVVFHSFYGVRTVLRDHVGPGVLRRALTLGLALVGLVLAGLGLSAIAGAPGPLP